VALTFDDGPSPQTLRTLELLDELGLAGTFFLVGADAEAHPGIVKEIVRSGHEVASHGMVHSHHLLRSPRAVLADLAAGAGALEAAGAERPRFFRPPYGQMSAATVAAARRAGMEVVLWSRWGKEFAATGPSVNEVTRRVTSGLRPGAIVVLHDSDSYAPPGTASLTHAVLPALAGELRRRNLAALRLGELVGEPLARAGTSAATGRARRRARSR
jgi:peptidoglycan/xylan/chitin deacetylase (PgdA/CDA1 family)